jgi:release factor glutamine methyltransferase
VTIGDVVRAATAWLNGNHVDEARLTAELLLARALVLNRAGLLARVGDPMPEGARGELDELMRRAALGEPIAYILGEREFYGLSFAVRPGVLIPRPETELLVGELLAFARRGEPVATVVDVGTGSGAIAVAVAVNLPNAGVLAIDRSREALAIADENVRRHGVADRVDLLLGDLLAGLAGEHDVVVANPPYVPTAQIAALQPQVRDWEPRIALDGGEDGLDPHRRLLTQLRGRLRPGGLVLMEIADDRGPAALAMARGMLPDADVDLLPDAFGRDRAIRAIFRAR